MIKWPLLKLKASLSDILLLAKYCEEGCVPFYSKKEKKKDENILRIGANTPSIPDVKARKI